MEATARGDSDVTNGANLSEQLDSAKAQLQDANSELTGLRDLAHSLRTELTSQKEISTDIRDRYERELSSHGETAKTVVELREKVSQGSTELQQAQTARDSLAEQLREEGETTRVKFDSLNQEFQLSKEQFEVMKSENGSLHVQLENLSTQLSALRQMATENEEAGGGGNTSKLDSSLLSKSFHEDDAKSTDQLMEIVKYLRKEKALSEQKVEVVQAESVRLHAQLESAQKELEETKTALVTATEAPGGASGGSKSLLPSSAYSALMEKVEALPAISDSNRVLRSQNEKLEMEMRDVADKYNKANAELEPLRATLKAREEEAEKTSAEMTAIKADNQRWKARVTQLIEKHQKISPEEMKKVQMENSKLQENLQVATSNNKNLAAKNNNLANQLKASQENLKQTTEEKTQEIKKLTQDYHTSKLANHQNSAKVTNLTNKNNQLETNLKTVMAERDGLKKDAEKASASAKAEAEALTN